MALPFKALLAAVAIVKWGSDVKPRMVCWVAANLSDELDVVEVGERLTSTYTGASRTAVRRSLRDLVESRVLVSVAGAGRRGHAFAVNEDLEQWHVPWLGVAVSDPSYATFREVAVKRVLDDFARPRVVHYGAVVARSGPAQTHRQNPSHTFFLSSRDNSLSRDDDSTTAASGRATERPSVLKPPTAVLSAVQQGAGVRFVNGNPRSRVIAACLDVDDLDAFAGEFTAELRRLPEHLRPRTLDAHVSLVEQLAWERNRPAAADDLDDLEPAVARPPAWTSDLDRLRSDAAPPPPGWREPVAPTCETDAERGLGAGG